MINLVEAEKEKFQSLKKAKQDHIKEINEMKDLLSQWSDTVNERYGRIKARLEEELEESTLQKREHKMFYKDIKVIRNAFSRLSQSIELRIRDTRKRRNKTHKKRNNIHSEEEKTCAISKNDKVDLLKVLLDFPKLVDVYDFKLEANRTKLKEIITYNVNECNETNLNLVISHVESNQMESANIKFVITSTATAGFPFNNIVQNLIIYFEECCFFTSPNRLVIGGRLIIKKAIDLLNKLSQLPELSFSLSLYNFIEDLLIEIEHINKREGNELMPLDVEKYHDRVEEMKKLRAVLNIIKF